MPNVWKAISDRAGFAREFYRRRWRWVVFLVWGLPYGLAELYDFLQSQEIWLTQYPSIGSLLPNWWVFAWSIVGGVIFLVVTLEGVYHIRHKELRCNLEAHPVVGKRASYEHVQYTAWAELKVTNTNPHESLEGVKVQIVERLGVGEEQDKKGSHYLYELCPPWSPANVYWSERNAEPNQLSLSISPNDSSCALIAFRGEYGGTIGIFNTRTQPPFLESRILIEVSSSNSGIWRKAYYIEYHPPARDEFEFMEWDSWCEKHNVTEPLAILGRP